jgi:hypothetical protein
MLPAVSAIEVQHLLLASRGNGELLSVGIISAAEPQ